MGKQGSNTTTNTTQVPAFVSQAGQQNIASADALAQTPFPAYNWAPLVAGLTGTQQQAGADILNAGSDYQSLLGGAQNYLGAAGAANPTANYAPAVASDQSQNLAYMNPINQLSAYITGAIPQQEAGMETAFYNANPLSATTNAVGNYLNAAEVNNPMTATTSAVDNYNQYMLAQNPTGTVTGLENQALGQNPMSQVQGLYGQALGQNPMGTVGQLANTAMGQNPTQQVQGLEGAALGQNPTAQVNSLAGLALGQNPTSAVQGLEGASLAQNPTGQSNLLAGLTLGQNPMGTVGALDQQAIAGGQNATNSGMGGANLLSDLSLIENPSNSQYMASLMNPYVQQSLQPQLLAAQTQLGQEQQQINSQATGANAFGDARQGAENALQNYYGNQNMAGIEAQGFNTAFTNAQNAALGEQGVLGNLANTALASGQLGQNQEIAQGNIASQYGQLGQGEQGIMNNVNQLLTGLGTTEQGLTQSAANELGNLGVSEQGISSGLAQMLGNLGLGEQGVTQNAANTLGTLGLGEQGVTSNLASLLGNLGLGEQNLTAGIGTSLGQLGLGEQGVTQNAANELGNLGVAEQGVTNAAAQNSLNLGQLGLGEQNLQNSLANTELGLGSQGLQEQQMLQNEQQYPLQMGQLQLGNMGELEGEQANLLGLGNQNISEQNAQMGEQGILGNLGTSEANLGSLTNQLALNSGNALMGVGNQQQATQQNVLNAAYQQFQAQQNWPFQMLGVQEGGLNGLTGSALGGESTSTVPSANSLTSGISGVGTLALMAALLCDRRTKEVRGEASGEVIARLKVHDAKYHWEDQSFPMFIADEVAQEAPWAVGGSRERGELQFVDTARLVPSIIAFMQEQQKRIEKLEALVIKLGGQYV